MAFVVDCEVDVFLFASSLSSQLTFKQRFCRDSELAAIQRVKARWPATPPGMVSVGRPDSISVKNRVSRTLGGGSGLHKFTGTKCLRKSFIDYLKYDVRLVFHLCVI